MAVAHVNLVLEKGTDFEASFFLSGEDGGILNLTESTATAKIKKYPSSPISHSFNVGIVTATGEISIAMTSGVTSQLSSGRNYFDVLVTNPLNIKTKVVSGSIIVEETTSL